MSASEIIRILVERDCPNITTELEPFWGASGPVSHGGFADVYQGVMRGRTSVAIKCPKLNIQRDDSQGHKVLKHAARELYIWSRLKHANVLELLGLAEYQNRIAMVSPWMANGTLLQYIRRNPMVDRYQLLVQIFQGVLYLHDFGVIHGDLKGGNILVSSEGVVKIADFGCTTLKFQTLRFTTSTENPAISARWTAPEVLNGEVHRSKEADVYSLGMVFLEVVTGRLPFDEIKRDVAVISAVHRGRTPARPDELVSLNHVQADLLWDLLERIWTDRPLRRPSLRDIQQRLLTIEGYAVRLTTEDISLSSQSDEQEESQHSWLRQQMREEQQREWEWECMRRASEIQRQQRPQAHMGGYRRFGNTSTAPQPPPLTAKLWRDPDIHRRSDNIFFASHPPTPPLPRKRRRYSEQDVRMAQGQDEIVEVWLT